MRDCFSLIWIVNFYACLFREIVGLEVDGVGSKTNITPGVTPKTQPTSSSADVDGLR